MMSAAVLAADPGLAYPETAEVSDQKAGSILFYNIYTSSASGSNTQNARLNITNTSSTSAAAVHLFFITSGCSVADSFICLTPNQTASFLASDIDPGITGYLVAVATDATGCPRKFNFLIGDEYVKFSSGHTANLGAEAFAKITADSTAECDGGSSEVLINFDNIQYNRAPRVLAVSSLGSNLDGNSTMIIVNRVGGSLVSGAATTGSLFGLLYDDAEAGVSFNLNGNCQVQGLLSNSFPRVTGTFTGFIGQGRTGWMKIYSSQGDRGLLGSVLTYNQNAGSQPSAFTGGRNMHKLTLSASNSYTIPVFPPNCDLN
ncbi:MAG: hypothetical protein HOP19_16685 [Acidobacteria bacterium]|nr:hypothetical protein [Acidobacteriota bacterium]